MAFILEDTITEEVWDFLYVQGEWWYAQTFKPSSNYILKMASLYLEKEGNVGDIIVSLRATSEGKPTGDDLAVKTLTAEEINSDGWNWNNFEFESGYSVSSDILYAIVLRSPDSYWNNNYRWAFAIGNPYPPGAEVDSDNSGATWVIYPDYAFNLKLYSAEPPPATDVSGKAILNTGVIVTTETISDYYWSWVYGIIDKPTMTYNADSNMCQISGRDYIAYLSETYLKKLWWGKNKKYNVVGEQKEYSMESDCTGIYRVFYDATGTRTAFKEITLNSEYTYDWKTNELVFLIPSVPYEDGAGCLWVYYFTAQPTENIVADLLMEAGILNASQKYTWLVNTNYCTPTGETVQRARFDSGTNYITAINMLTETAPLYRFYIDVLGMPCFKRIPLLSETIKRIDDTEYLIRSTEERLDELYNHFILIGEKRIMKEMNLSVITYTQVEMEQEIPAETFSGKFRGAILDSGGSNLILKGFKWQEEGAETWQDWHVSGATIGAFNYTVTGLIKNTTYKFYAYGQNASGEMKQTPEVYFDTPEIEEE